MTTEGRLFAHACEKKRRWLAKDDKSYKMAFIIFSKFYSISYPMMKTRTYRDFINSSLFTAFAKFGKYLIEIQAINPDSFVVFLIKSQAPMKNWTMPFVYEQFVRDLNKREPAASAMERNILLMQQWELDSGIPWTEFFKQVSTSLAIIYIRSGRLSPWVLYTANTAVYLLDRMSEEQLQMIERCVDPRFWTRKFIEFPDDTNFVRELLLEVGV
jgi:hypothetical protein